MRTSHRTQARHKREELTVERLRELLHYDPETGLFTRLVRTSNFIRVGDVAGSFTSSGYRQIYVEGMNCRANRLAWLYMTGEWPKHCIDHINGITSDDRWCNLRDVTVSVNMQNLKTARRDSKTGILGVTKLNTRFVARMKYEGRQLHLGSFATPEEAQAAYLAAKRRLHEGCTI